MSDIACTNSVDIIMPTYNPDPALVRRAIASIVGQTYRDWRLFIVNDGGEADISGMVRGFGDRRIDYYDMPHRGKPAALNFAIGRGAAKYIAYLDDDDIWYPNHLEAAVSCMEQNGARFVHTDAHEISVTREGDVFKEIARGSLNRGIVTDTTLWFVSHINAVHERSLLDDAGIYDEERTFFIDWDMFQRMARHARPHHLKVVTCAHYWYLDGKRAETNIISSIHRKNPELSKKALHEMFRRAYEIVSAEDFADIVEELLEKDSRLEQTIGELNRIYQSRTWQWGSRIIGFVRMLAPENSLRRKIIQGCTRLLK